METIHFLKDEYIYMEIIPEIHHSANRSNGHKRRVIKTGKPFFSTVRNGLLM